MLNGQIIRCFRVFQSRMMKPRVQYGYWAPSVNGIQPRFHVFREWPVSDITQAETLKAQLQLDVLLDKDVAVASDAKPLPSRQSIRRDVRQLPEDTRELLVRAVAGLRDPLPSLEESHATLGVAIPQPHRSGRSITVYLSDPVYARLVAMAAAADVNRNRLIEALVLAADEMTFEREAHDDTDDAR